jgi:hypothetical protein
MNVFVGIAVIYAIGRLHLRTQRRRPTTLIEELGSFGDDWIDDDWIDVDWEDAAPTRCTTGISSCLPDDQSNCLQEAR